MDGKCVGGVTITSDPCPVCGATESAESGRIHNPLLRIVDGYNILRDAVVWFDSHEVEKKLGHLPQWMVTARELLKARATNARG